MKQKYFCVQCINEIVDNLITAHLLRPLWIEKDPWIELNWNDKLTIKKSVEDYEPDRWELFIKLLDRKAVEKKRPQKENC